MSAQDHLAAGLCHAINCAAATGGLRFDPPLGSPGYAAQIDRLVGKQPDPPRQDWPVDTAALIRHHSEVADMALGWAVKHLRAATALCAGL